MATIKGRSWTQGESDPSRIDDKPSRHTSAGPALRPHTVYQRTYVTTMETIERTDDYLHR